jgi:hypothetical protein
MKRIEDYIEKVYRNFDEKDEETKVLKEETKVHLFEEVEELKKLGFTEEESINKALSNFGSEQVVISELNLILKKQNKFSKILRNITITIFIIACVFLSINIVDGFIHRNEPNPFTYNKNTTAYVMDYIENNIKNKDNLDADLKNQITQSLDEFNTEHNNGLYFIKIARVGKPSSDYEYKKEVSEDMILGGNGGVKGVFVNGKEVWSIYYNRTDNQVDLDYTAQQGAWDKMVNRVPNRLGQASNYLFVTAAALLCIYIINKIYLKSSFLSK